MSALVLLTEDLPSYGVLAAARALRAAGFRVAVAATDSGGYCSRSSAVDTNVTVPSPTLDAAGFVDVLAGTTRNLDAVALLPGTETALQVLAAARDSFAPELGLGTCEVDVVRRATDKTLLPALASAAGTTVPLTREVPRRDVAAALQEVGAPAVVKPLDRAALPAAAGFARRIDSAADAANLSLPEGKWLVQPYLEGVLYAVGGVAWGGDIVCTVHQVAHRISPPDCGGTAYGETVPPDVRLDETARRLVAEIGWSGIFQVQFIRTAAADYLIDFNPRIYGTLALPVAAGLNLPAIWVERLLGGAAAFDGYAAGVRFRSEEKEGLAALAALRRRDWRTVASVLTPRRRTTHAAFAAADPLPVLTSLVKVRRARNVLRTHSGAGAHESA